MEWYKIWAEPLNFITSRYGRGNKFSLIEFAIFWSLGIYKLLERKAMNNREIPESSSLSKVCPIF